MNKSFLFLFYCFFCVSLYGTTEFTEPQDVATTEGLPSSLVNQAVCAITGEYIHSVVDLVVPGPEPLIIHRMYASHSEQPWFFNHQEKLLLRNMIYKGKISTILFLYQPSGSCLNYYCSDKKVHKVEEYDLIKPKGLTNGATQISGKTNIKNQKVIHHTTDQLIEVVSGAGNKKVFEFFNMPRRGTEGYRLEKEENVNGFCYRHLGDETEVFTSSEIRCENRNTGEAYSYLKFHETDLGGENRAETVLSSDGRKLRYFFERDKHYDEFIYNGINTIPNHRFYLTKVDHPYALKEKYEYAEKAGSDDRNLIRIARDEGKRFVEIEYYHKDKNHVGGIVGTINLKKGDFRLDRVKKLRAPVGTDSTSIMTHRFDYHAKIKFNYGKEIVEEGYTDVYDANDHKTRYEYDDQHRLTSIIAYQGDQPYSQEKFVWDKEGFLQQKIFMDGQGNIHHARVFTYDSRGNVIKRRLFGALTGKQSPNPFFDDKNKLITEGCECETKTYTYSNDGLNLLLSQTDSNGITISYDYEEKSDRLKTKFISFEERIRLREFFFYDEHHVLIKKIADDGSDKSHKLLTDVTERHITKIQPRTETPLGLPEIVEEWAGIGNENNLLNRKVYAYSQEGRLIKEQVFDSNEDFVYALKWDYDQHGNLIRETNAEGTETKRIYDLATDNLIEEETLNVVTHNTYDFVDRHIAQKEVHPDQKLTTHQTYDFLGNLTSTTNPYGHETTQTYDDFGRVIAVQYPPVPNEEGNLVQPTISKEYDIAGFPLSITDANGRKILFKSNIRGQPTEIIYPDSTKEEMRYSLDGRLLQKIEKNGLRTEYVRDPLGRVLTKTIDGGDQKKETTNVYNAFHLLETTDPEGHLTKYTYDTAGRLIKTCKNSRCTENIYDSLCRLSEIREYYGDKPLEYRATLRKYDKLDRIIEERLQNSEGLTLHLSCYEYDKRGNCTLAQVGDQKTITEYDSHNQPIKMTDSLNHETHIEYNYHFSNQYGQKVLQKTTTDPLGYRTVDTYDTANRIVETIRLNPLGIRVGRQSIYYDLCGNKKRIEEDVIVKGKISRTLQTLFQYNAVNEMTEIIEAAYTPEQKITRIHYNAYGQKESLTKPDGTVLHYTYDSFGRLKRQLSSDQSISYLYEYNLIDQLTKVTDQLSKKATQLTYNDGQLQTEVLANGLRLDYTYDKTGRIRTIAFPDKTGIEYCYNAVDLKEIHRIINGKRVYSHHDQDHSLSGQVIKALIPGNNGSVDYAYDSIGRCIKIDSADFQQNVPPDGFDAAGNLIKFEAQKTSYQFSYDDHYQINSEKGHFNHTYSFDSFANRISKDEEILQHNALNQLIKKGNEKLTYDLNGNLIRNGKFEYTYDALDRLIKVIQGEKSILYTYDSFNRRMTKKQNGEEELFLYQGQDEIGKWKNGKCQEIRLLGNNKLSRTAALEIDGIPYIPLHDMSGNIVSLLNLQGKQIEQYRYTAFGETEILSPSAVRLSRSAINNPWQYAGKRFDEESGLIAFGMRYYNPNFGRWITPDPAGYADGTNFYAYVHNNPFKFFDRLGLFSEEYELSWDPVFPDYQIYSFDDIHHGFAGTVHGGVDFFTNQAAGMGSFCCSIGSHEWDDPQDRLFSTISFAESSAGHLNRFDNWFTDSLHVDPSNAIYQNFRSASSLSLEAGSLFAAGYGAVKAGMEFAALSRLSQGVEFAGGLGFRGLKCSSKEGVLATLDSRINQLSRVNQSLDLNALSRAGQVMDRNGLTKAGRAYQKHCNRPNSVFSKMNGKAHQLNQEGQYYLDNILTDPNRTINIWNHRGLGEVVDFETVRHGGVRFYKNGHFIGFLEP